MKGIILFILLFNTSFLAVNGQTEKKDWLKVNNYHYKFNVNAGFIASIPNIGLRYYFLNHYSSDIRYGYYQRSTTNGYNDSKEKYHFILVDVNAHIKPSFFMISLIYINSIRTSTVIKTINENSMFATIGIMSNNKVNFYARGGLGGFIGKRFPLSVLAILASPSLYVDIGIGYNFNFKKSDSKNNH